MERKTYKHIASGRIAKETKSGKGYVIDNNTAFLVPSWIIEKGNDWMEIKKPIFEILTFIHNDGGIITKNSTGLFFHEGMLLGIEEEQIKASIHYKIHSVKRLSDNVVFKLNNTVRYDGIVGSDSFKVDNIFLRNDGVLLLRNKGNSMVETLETLKHVNDKDFEVLTYDLNGNQFDRVDDGMYVCRNTRVNLGTLINANIVSIRRLSDDEVFKIGDRIKFEHYTKLIVEFKVSPIKTIQAVLPDGVVSLEELDLAKPLFETYDGVPIYKGEKYYIWNTNKIGQQFEFTYNIAKNLPISSAHIAFSSIEKAHNHKIWCTKSLSLNDLKEFLDSGYDLKAILDKLSLGKL